MEWWSNGVLELQKITSIKKIILYVDSFYYKAFI